MLSIKFVASLAGMLSSYGVLAVTNFETNKLLEGGALLAFVSFLIYAIKLLRSDLKIERAKNDCLNEEAKNSLASEVRYSRQSNEKLVDELRKQREARESDKKK